MKPTEQEQFSVKSRLRSFVYAAKGIMHVLKKERNIWLQLFIAALAVTGGFLLKISSTEWIVIILCIGIVLSFEIMNTAIENMVDFISPGYNKKAGIIKDIAAGAVLITATMSLIIGIIIFAPKIKQLIMDSGQLTI